VATIWFACKGCGRRHRRPDTAAGTLVFCPCGEGNRVPWESTVAPEEAEVPAAADAAAPSEGAPPPEPPEEEEPLPRRRRRAIERRDPSLCFNHPDVPSVRTCAACGEHFCDNCVITLRDRTLCGPCKNFDVRTMQRSAGVSSLAIVSLCVGLISNPIAFCSTLAAMGAQTENSAGMFVASLIGVVAPLAAVAAGVRALADIDKKPRLGGQAVAITGMVTGGVSLLWCLTLLLIVAVRAAQGE
jgi:hypothetical protein